MAPIAGKSASIMLMRLGYQVSHVMIWNTVSKDMPMLSKFTTPN